MTRTGDIKLETGIPNMANEAQEKQLKDYCEAIAKWTSENDDLIKRPEWGEITFESIENDIETVLWLVNEIKRLPTYGLPESVIQKTNDNLSRISGIFSRINNFTISDGDAVSLRDSIAKQFEKETQNLMCAIGIWVPVLALRAGEIGDWVAKAEKTSVDTANILQETIEYSTRRKKEIDEIVQAIREVAVKAGAAEFTHEFRSEAENVEKRSKRWLWATGFFAASAFILSGLILFGLLGEAPTNTWEAVYQLGGRVLAISVLFYAAVWSSRVVLANMHLASVNKHRAVSLETLQAFHQAAKDSAVKDAVVLEAARAVYENVPSGYIGRQATEQGANARMIEILRGANRADQSSE